MALEEITKLKHKLKELLDKGFTRPSISLLGALVLFVKKKDDSLIMCIDYKQLNKVKSRISIPSLGLINCLTNFRDLATSQR